MQKKAENFSGRHTPSGPQPGMGRKELNRVGNIKKSSSSRREVAAVYLRDLVTIRAQIKPAIPEQTSDTSRA